MCRINIKALKGIPNFPPEKAVQNDGYNLESPVYSQSEVILLKWIESVYEEYYRRTTCQRMRLTSCESEFRNGEIIATLLEHYIGNNMNLLPNMKKVFETEEDYKFNNDKVLEKLIENGVQGIFEFRDLIAPQAREMMLFAVHLFQTLPHFVPKQTVEFTCLLDEKITKYIQLTNPSHKPIYYWARLQGHRDFAIETDYVKIEPKSQVQFPVTYRSNLSKVTNSVITFRNKRDAGVQAAALVFNLKSNVIGRESREKREVKGVKLYELGTIEVNIVNPFDTDVDFNIKIENIEIIPELSLKKPKKKKRRNVGKKNEEAEENKNDVQKLYIPCFFSKKDRIKIRKNGESKLQVFYLPLTFDNHKCNIVFVDERVGEMQYELIGTPELPNPLETIKISSWLDYNKQEDISNLLFLIKYRYFTKKCKLQCCSNKTKRKIKRIEKR